MPHKHECNHWNMVQLLQVDKFKVKMKLSKNSRGYCDRQACHSTGLAASPAKLLHPDMQPSHV